MPREKSRLPLRWQGISGLRRTARSNGIEERKILKQTKLPDTGSKPGGKGNPAPPRNPSTASVRQGRKLGLFFGRAEGKSRIPRYRY